LVANDHVLLLSRSSPITLPLIDAEKVRNLEWAADMKAKSSDFTGAADLQEEANAMKPLVIQQQHLHESATQLLKGAKMALSHARTNRNFLEMGEWQAFVEHVEGRIIEGTRVVQAAGWIKRKRRAGWERMKDIVVSNFEESDAAVTDAETTTGTDSTGTDSTSFNSPTGAADATTDMTGTSDGSTGADSSAVNSPTSTDSTAFNSPTGAADATTDTTGTQLQRPVPSAFSKKRKVAVHEGDGSRSSASTKTITLARLRRKLGTRKQPGTAGPDTLEHQSIILEKHGEGFSSAHCGCCAACVDHEKLR
jgi:hypothetical protein